MASICSSSAIQRIQITIQRNVTESNLRHFFSSYRYGCSPYSGDSPSSLVLGPVPLSTSSRAPGSLCGLSLNGGIWSQRHKRIDRVLHSPIYTKCANERHKMSDSVWFWSFSVVNTNVFFSFKLLNTKTKYRKWKLTLNHLPNEIWDSQLDLAFK